MSKHSAKTFRENCCYFFYHFFFSRVFLQIVNYQSHCIPLIWQLRSCIEFFQFIDYLLHGWSRPRLSLQTSPYQATKRAICYKHHLFFPPLGIWKLPDAHFTKKNTKAVNINLTTLDHLNKSIFLPRYAYGILRLKFSEVWFSLCGQHPGQLCTAAEMSQLRLTSQKINVTHKQWVPFGDMIEFWAE